MTAMTPTDSAATATWPAAPTVPSTPATSVPIAIVGMAAMMPGAPNLDTYWRNIVGGVDAVTEVPASRWDPEFYDPAAPADRADRVYCRAADSWTNSLRWTRSSSESVQTR